MGRMRTSIIVCAALSVLITRAAAAEDFAPTDSVNAERVVALARTRAPLVRHAESRLSEALGRLAGARALGQSNPSIEGVASVEDRFEQRTQWELNVPIGIGLAWAARTGLASAEVERDRQVIADARRGAIGAALAAYYRVLHSAEKLELAKARRSLADELRRSAEERHRAGKIPRLETLLAQVEQVRAESALLAEEQEHARQRIMLAATLGLPSGEDLAVGGTLDDRSLMSRALEAPGPAQRPDVLAAEREVRASGAALSLARTGLLPGLAFRLHYGHEGGEPMVRPGLAITVPIFQNGQEARAAARARESQARADLERTRNAATAEAEGLTRAYAAAVEAADALAGRALPQVEESESMVHEAYRSGKINLPALLIVRRDLLDTRRDYVDRLLDAALAAIDLAVARGTLQ